jgi:hypothetical protein
MVRCKSRHRQQEFLSFLRRIGMEEPLDPYVHMIVNNICTYKHAKVRASLAERPRLHVHDTPTYLPGLQGEALVWNDRPTSDSAWKLLQRQGADFLNRALHR